jgi:hypothetical protein
VKPRRDKNRRYQTNPGMAAVPAPLPALRKRLNVRVVVPPTMALYARVRSSARATGVCRGVVGDLSAAGMAVTVIEGGRFELPREGQDVTVELDFEGTAARVAGKVVRVGARQISIAYPVELRDETLNEELLSLIARVVTKRVDYMDARRFVHSLHARLAHRHFAGAGYLDLRVQVDAPAWWQVVFLEYLTSWSEAGGLETGILDRSYSTERPSDALAMRTGVTRHPAPWRSLLRLTHLIAGQCLLALPAHADCFALVQRTLAPAL